MNKDRSRAPRRIARATVALALLLSFALTACTLPGTLAPTATTPSSPVASATVATATPDSPSPTATGTPAATATATRGSRTPSPSAATPSPATPASPAGASPTPGPFKATADEPCRATELDHPPLPEKPSSVDTIEQSYRCFLLHYVDHKTFDHRVLLNGSWSYLAQAGSGLFTADDTAPLALVNDREADWAVYKDRYNALAKKYARTVDPSILARAAIDGMARSLNDNHVAYLEPKLWERSYAEEVGENTIIGPGFDLAIDEGSGQFYLYSVYPNTPAAKAGLKAGDVIEQVGGRPARKGTGNQGLYNLLTGPVGTRASMQVSRPSTGQTINAQVSVAEVEVPLIESRVLDGQIGYLKLRNFSKNAGDEFDKALADLQAQGIKGFIFDVRQNPGGSVDALTHIVSHLTHQGPLAISIDDDGKREDQNPDEAVPLLGLPWVVLCNNGSASSSDITSAVAKDRGGHLVGEKSAGALGGAEIYELEDGSAIEITVVRVLGPNGEEINNVGVTPDHLVTLTPADLSAGNDPQLQHALTDLTGR